MNSVLDMLAAVEASALDAKEAEEELCRTTESLLALTPPHVAHDPPTEAAGNPSYTCKAQRRLAVQKWDSFHLKNTTQMEFYIFPIQACRA